MPTTNLTDRTIRALQPSGNGQVAWMDESLPGFGVRVGGKSGRKTFFVRYRNRSGTRRLYTLGTYPATKLADARTHAKAVLARAARGEDPAEERKREGVTVRDFAKTYVKRHAKAKRSGDRDERTLEKDVLPRIGDKLMVEVTKKDLVEILDAVNDRGAPVQANRVRALLTKFFNFAMERDEVALELSPAQGLPRYAKEQPRKNALSADEIRAVWSALGEEHPVTAGIFKMILLTAQRPGEVKGMNADELAGDWWELPASRTKNGRAHRVPLSPEALAVLAEIEAVRGGKPPDPWVFPSRQEGKPVRWIQKAAERIREASGVEFTPHDLRATAASGLAELGAPRVVLQRVLNHVDPTVTSRYDQYSYDSEAGAALNQWGARVREIVGGEW